MEVISRSAVEKYKNCSPEAIKAIDQNWTIRNLKALKNNISQCLVKGCEPEDQYLLDTMTECADELIRKIKERQKHHDQRYRSKLHTYPNSRIVHVT